MSSNFMSVFATIATAVCGMAAMVFSLELVLLGHHRVKYGPYNFEEVKLIEYQAFCKRKESNLGANYYFSYFKDGEQHSTLRPFFGQYPFRICFGKKLFPLLDRQKFSNFKNGQMAQVFFDKNGRIYFGKTNVVTALSGTVVFFGLALVFFALRKKFELLV